MRNIVNTNENYNMCWMKKVQSVINKLNYDDL